jgi:hypothetical protein
MGTPRTPDQRDSEAATHDRPIGQRPSGDRSRLTASSGSTSDEHEYASATDILKDIGQAFKRNRRTGRMTAWADLQSKIMGNPQILVPNVMTLEGWIKVGIAIEDFMRTEEGVKSEDPIAALRGYLNGDDTLLAKPKVQ